VIDDEPVAGRFGRLALLFSAHAVGTATITLVVALAPAIGDALGLGRAGFGVMVSAYYGATLVFALPAGWLVDRFGLRAVLVAAHALLAAGVLLLAGASGLATGAAALALCGSGYAMINPATARGVLLWFPARARATAMGVKQTGVPAGGVIAALIAAAGHADWRALAVGMAVVTVLAGAACLRLSDTPRGAAAVVRLADIAALLRRPQLALFNGATALYAAGQATFFAYLVLFARDALAVPVALASLCLATAHVASAAARIGWGVVSDRLARGGRIACLVAIGIAGSIGVTLLLLLPGSGTVALVGTAALVGATLGGFAGLTQAAAVESVEPTRVGAAIGYNMLLVGGGNMLGPAAFGAAVEWAGYPAAWGALAVLLLAGAGLFQASIPRRAR